MKLRDEKAPWVERDTLVEASPEEVWEALTDEDRERFAFTWSRPGEGESFVEFTIEPLPGGSRVTVVETPIGPTASAVGGWDPRLVRLGRAARFALVA